VIELKKSQSYYITLMLAQENIVITIPPTSILVSVRFLEEMQLETQLQFDEYKPDNWEDVPCPLCDTRHSRIHERFGHRYQYTYVECLKCRNIYQSPRPKYDEHFLKAAYGNYYLYDKNHQYGESKYNDFNKEISEIIKYDTKRSAILDVGCAMGDFLYQAKKHYMRAFGAEIASNMADSVSKHLNIKVFTQQYEQIVTDEQFSCIHMSHIIEHIPNPRDWLKKAATHLDPDGILVVCVPNMHSLTRMFKLFLKRIGLRKGRWKNPRRTPDHLFEPTVAGMRYFFPANGYDIVKIYSYSRSNMIAEGLFGYFFHHVLKLGSNLRIYARIKQKGTA
jgi:2-polyprenyl-3-methyl-5-hydroxy-6-metoxy-1,4-benzoquinol methylase